VASTAPITTRRVHAEGGCCAEFVAATGHMTDAERLGWSFGFGGLVPDDVLPTRTVTAAPWWRQVHEANWCHPEELSDKHRMNVWQGRFPTENTLADGYGTCPVDAFPPNGYGLYNSLATFGSGPRTGFLPRSELTNPRTTPSARSAGRTRSRRGGSYLCHASYCRRYRAAARRGNESDSAAGNLGFGCAASVPRA
jgi:hypothetical protein